MKKLSSLKFGTFLCIASVAAIFTGTMDALAVEKNESAGGGNVAPKATVSEQNGSNEISNPACIPSGIRHKPGTTSWQLTEQAKAQKEGQTVPVLFLGDSITQCWSFAADNKYPGGLDSWNKYFKPMGAVNFGISADLTEHVLWRVTDGEQLKINPKIVILLIGTNNLHRAKKADSSAQVAEGIKFIVDAIRQKSPDSKILLLGLLPRSWDATASKKVGEVNSIIAGYADNKQVFYFDASPFLLDKSGNISKEIFRDGIHLSPLGYELFAQALLPEIKKLQETK